MKKSVMIIVAAVYVLGIVFVGFFGMRITFYEEKKDVTEVKCTNNELSVMDDGRRTIIFAFEPDENGEMKYQFLWRVLPDDATDKSVQFSCEGTKFSINQKGVLTIKGTGTVTVMIKAQDGSNKLDKIDVTVLRSQP